MSEKTTLIKIGDFFFKWRNYLFPVMLAAMFIVFTPPSHYFQSEIIEEMKDWAAFALVLAGLVFRGITIGWAYIKRGGLNKEVYADTLVTAGMFGVCRNPLYVGNLMIYSGIFLMHGHPVIMVGGTAIFLFIYVAIVAAEEFFLQRKFGDEFTAYCRAVPRWVPNFHGYRQSIAGMNFSIKRWIVKDYTTILNAMVALSAIELFETYAAGFVSVYDQSVEFWCYVIVGLLLCVAAISAMKKSGKLSA